MAIPFTLPSSLMVGRSTRRAPTASSGRGVELPTRFGEVTPGRHDPRHIDEVGIHDYFPLKRRGWCACAHHDEERPVLTGPSFPASGVESNQCDRAPGRAFPAALYPNAP